MEHVLQDLEARTFFAIVVFAFMNPSDTKNGNDLGKLGNVEALPTQEEITIFVQQNFAVKGVLSSDDDMKIHQKAKEYLNNNDALSAWKVLLAKQ